MSLFSGIHSMGIRTFTVILLLAIVGPPLAQQLGQSLGTGSNVRPAAEGQLLVVEQGVLLHFWRPTCPVSVKTHARVRVLQRQGYPIRSVNTLRSKRKSREYRIDATPTFVWIERGNEQWRRAGGYDAREVAAMCR